MGGGGGEVCVEVSCFFFFQTWNSSSRTQASLGWIPSTIGPC